MRVLERMRWWHIEELLPIERQLFGEEPWTARTVWSELGQLDTRHSLVAVDGGLVVGYAGLCAYPDEAFVQTLGVAPQAQGEGLGAQLLQALGRVVARAHLEQHHRAALVGLGEQCVEQQ